MYAEPPQSERDSDIGKMSSHLLNILDNLTSTDVEHLPPLPRTKRPRSLSLSTLSDDTESISATRIDSNRTELDTSSPSAFPAQAPYDDEFGLERPPPVYNLEGRWNTNQKTGVNEPSLPHSKSKTINTNTSNLIAPQLRRPSQETLPFPPRTNHLHQPKTIQQFRHPSNHKNRRHDRKIGRRYHDRNY